MNKIILNSFAKINFGLNVISKRPDGYHDIESIFYPLKLHDKLIIEKSGSFNFKSSSSILSSDENNLVIKSKEILEKYFRRDFRINIFLEKNIPIGAGLGGGSSNAASTLSGINELFQLGLSHKDLIEIAAQLGSDVPFFLETIPAFVERKGEVLTKINFKIDRPILLVNPGIHISTAWAYSKIKPQKPLQKLNEIIKNGFKDISEIRGVVTNDFEKIVFEYFPEIEEIKSEMYKLGAGFSLMTGSGSSVFGIFPDLDQAKFAGEIFSRKYFTFIHTEE